MHPDKYAKGSHYVANCRSVNGHSICQWMGYAWIRILGTISKTLSGSSIYELWNIDIWINVWVRHFVCNLKGSVSNSTQASYPCVERSDFMQRWQFESSRFKRSYVFLKCPLTSSSDCLLFPSEKNVFFRDFVLRAHKLFVKWVPGARFTNSFLPAIQIRWKFRLAITLLLAIRS